MNSCNKNYTKSPLTLQNIKCNKIGNILWIWSHLLKTSLMENFIFIRYEYCGVLLLVLTARKG